MTEQGQQRVAIVTGAGRGIGREIALALARRGFALCITARSRGELEETRRLSGLKASCSLIVLADLAHEDAPDQLFGAALDHFGRLDLLVNNAGWAPARTPLVKLRPADEARMLAVNLRAPIALTRMAAAQMERQKEGAIINIASSAARSPGAGEAVYAAAKAGLIAFTYACFHEFRRCGIKMSVIIPGLVDTALIPANKRLNRAAMLTAADVAAAVMTIVNSPPHVNPVEIALEPQRDPFDR
ncbi:MAG: SDR family oxidoreductase [Candidatus Binataceae bacterium]